MKIGKTWKCGKITFKLITIVYWIRIEYHYWLRAFFICIFLGFEFIFFGFRCCYCYCSSTPIECYLYCGGRTHPCSALTPAAASDWFVFVFVDFVICPEICRLRTRWWMDGSDMAWQGDTLKSGAFLFEEIRQSFFVSLALSPYCT